MMLSLDKVAITLVFFILLSTSNGYSVNHTEVEDILSDVAKLVEDIEKLGFGDEQQGNIQTFVIDEPKSCLEIKTADPSAGNGLYSIYSRYGIPYQTFCEMDTMGGGWTLIASIHENRLGSGGRCTTGDKWSSENGLFDRDGDSNWENTVTFGDAAYATSDDYKNKGYFELQAKRMMLIQVPNNTPVDKYVSDAYFQYYTATNLLETYGGNLGTLFKMFPVKDNGLLSDYVDNGPSAPIKFVKGDAVSAHNQIGPSAQVISESGYLQFRAVEYCGNSAPLCPYGKILSDNSYIRHQCFGYTGDEHPNQCGDFSGFDCSGYGTHIDYSTSLEMVESAYLILYR